jgi:predicted GNAT family acetyltransferase
MDIKIEEANTKGAAFIEENGKRLAEMTYSIASPTLIIIDHTEVDESLKGQGVGKKLLVQIVRKARNSNTKIIPLCPFAKSVFNKEESIQDVLK